MDVDVEPFSLPLASPLHTADGTIQERSGFLVRAATGDADSAAVGIGEATPLPGWTESHAVCRRVLETAVSALRSRDDAELLAVADGLSPTDVSTDGGPTDGPPSADPLASLFDEEAFADLDSVDGIEDAPAARHGLELALLDVAARRADNALYRRLGADDVVDAVSVNATIGDAPPGDTAASARAARDAGYDTLKLKVGARSIDEDARRVRAVRRDVAGATSVRLDANGAWDVESAHEALSTLESYDLDYVEQPVPAEDVTALAALREHGVDVAVDESVPTLGIEEIVEREAADVVVLKPMVLGGPARTVAIARRARAADLDVVVSTTVDGVVARTAALHVAAALAPIAPCGLATADLLETDLGLDPAPVTDGEMTIPQGPGVGLDPTQLDVGDGEPD